MKEWKSDDPFTGRLQRLICLCLESYTVVYRSVKCYLWIYLSKQNYLSSTSHVLKSCLLWCCGLSPSRTCWTEYSVNTSLGSVWTHLLELTYHQFLLCLQTHCCFCSREVFKPDQNNYWNLLKWIFFTLKWGIKWNSFFPILHSASRKKFVTTETLGPILSSSAFPQVVLWLAIT